MMMSRLSRKSLLRGRLVAASFAALVATAFAGLPAPPAAAELVVLEGGRFYKATSYAVEGDRVRVALLAGGTVTLPLSRVERIIDDEVMPREEQQIAEAAGAASFSWRFAEGDQVPATPYGELIFEAAKRHQVNPALVAALVRAESAFDVRAVSHKGAQGLMQLMPATARRFGLETGEAFQPERNLEAGTRYLAWLLQRFDGDVPRALAAYNAGEGTVDRFGGVPPYRETRTYLKRIYATLGLSDDPVLTALL